MGMESLGETMSNLGVTHTHTHKNTFKCVSIQVCGLARMKTEPSQRGHVGYTDAMAMHKHHPLAHLHQ